MEKEKYGFHVALSGWPCTETAYFQLTISLMIDADYTSLVISRYLAPKNILIVSTTKGKNKWEKKLSKESRQ